MKKSSKIFLIIVGIIVVLGLFVAGGAYFTVDEDEYACVVRFAKIIDVKGEAGLYFKMPFIDSIKTYPKNMQLYDVKPSDGITKDKKTMQVDCYVVWKISDPLRFYQTLGYISEAETRLDTIAYNNVKTILGTLNQSDIINENPPEERNEIYREITEKVKVGAESYGIEVIDVKIKRFDLPSENEQAVYTRMISERNQMAEKYRADGEYQAALIINEVDKKYNIIISDAKLEAEKLVAEGEKQYMKILSEAYNTPAKREFYEFLRGLDALKSSLNGDETTIILGKDSEIAKILTGVAKGE